MGTIENSILHPTTLEITPSRFEQKSMMQTKITLLPWWNVMIGKIVVGLVDQVVDTTATTIFEIDSNIDEVGRFANNLEIEGGTPQTELGTRSAK